MSTDQGCTVPWESGSWTNVPQAVERTALGLMVTATPHSDAWRGTPYGVVKDSANALLTDFKPGQAMEVAFIADMTEQFDQAGLFLRVNDEHWVKTGMELDDGLLQLGAVVTNGSSDWSACCMADWNGRPVRIRASWSEDAITIRASVDGDPFRLVRLFPLDTSLTVKAGPYVASPVRSDFSITFTDWRTTPPDTSVH